MKPSANKAGAGNRARAVSFQVERLGRAVPDLFRWAKMRSHKSKCMVFGLALAMGLVSPEVTSSAQNSGPTHQDVDQLQGKWKLVYQEADGKKLPDEKEAEMFHGQMVFSGDKIHYQIELPGFDFKFTYRLHPDQHPKGIDLTLTETPDGKGEGQTMLGIYRLKAGTLEICHSKTKRPSDFTAGEGSHQVLIVLKRVPKQP